MKRDPLPLPDDAFARLEHEQLLARAALSMRAKIEFFEAMLELRAAAARWTRIACHCAMRRWVTRNSPWPPGRARARACMKKGRRD